MERVSFFTQSREPVVGGNRTDEKAEVHSGAAR